MVGVAGLEPAIPCSQSKWISRYPILRNLASGEGFEPPDSRPGFGDQCTTPTVPTRLKLFTSSTKKAPKQVNA